MLFGGCATPHSLSEKMASTLASLDTLWECGNVRSLKSLSSVSAEIFVAIFNASYVRRLPDDHLSLPWPGSAAARYLQISGTCRHFSWVTQWRLAAEVQQGDWSGWQRSLAAFFVPFGWLAGWLAGADLLAYVGMACISSARKAAVGHQCPSRDQKGNGDAFGVRA